MANLKVSEQAYPTTRYTEAAAPATPAAGEVVIYAKSDGLLYSKDDAGVETVVTGGGAAGAVATDTIWDAAGDIVVGTGANTAAKLAAGTDGHVLTLAAGTPAWQAPGTGSMVWLQRQTASASATLDFTSFISSTYDTYEFVFTNLIVATDAALFYMRMGTGGGPTYDAGTNYSWTGWRWLSSTSGTTGANSGANEIRLLIAVDTASALWSINGTVRLYNPAGAVLYKPVTGQFFFLDNATAVGVGVALGGSYNSATAVTAVRFLASTGNITSGTIDVYGLKHA